MKISGISKCHLLITVLVGMTHNILHWYETAKSCSKPLFVERWVVEQPIYEEEAFLDSTSRVEYAADYLGIT